MCEMCDAENKIPYEVEHLEWASSCINCNYLKITEKVNLCENPNVHIWNLSIANIEDWGCNKIRPRIKTKDTK